MKSPFAIINEIIDSDDGFVRFHFSAHTKGALLYIASCYVVRTTIKGAVANARNCGQQPLSFCSFLIDRHQIGVF